MKKFFVVCLVALLAGCAMETLPEEDVSIEDQQHETSGVFSNSDPYRDPCSFVGGVRTVYINGKEHVVYEPVVCVQQPELFPELKPDIVEDKVDSRVREPVDSFEDIVGNRVIR